MWDFKSFIIWKNYMAILLPPLGILPIHITFHCVNIMLWPLFRFEFDYSHETWARFLFQCGLTGGGRLGEHCIHNLKNVFIGWLYFIVYMLLPGNVAMFISKVAGTLHAFLTWLQVWTRQSFSMQEFLSIIHICIMLQLRFQNKI